MKHLTNVIKTLIIGYIATVLLLMALSFLLYKFGMSEMVINIMIVTIYVIACLLGGLLLAKIEKRKRIFWGIGYGIMYYGILLLVALIINKGVAPNLIGSIRAIISCLLAGGVGGYISPN